MAVPHVREVEATASRFLGCERREVTVGQAQGGPPEADLEEGGGGRVDGGVVRDGEDDGAARHRAGETADDLAAAPGRRGDSVGGEEDAVVGAEVLDETGPASTRGTARRGWPQAEARARAISCGASSGAPWTRTVVVPARAGARRPARAATASSRSVPGTGAGVLTGRPSPGRRP